MEKHVQSYWYMDKHIKHVQSYLQKSMLRFSDVVYHIHSNQLPAIYNVIICPNR